MEFGQATSNLPKLWGLSYVTRNESESTVSEEVLANPTFFTHGQSVEVTMRSQLSDQSCAWSIVHTMFPDDVQ